MTGLVLLTVLALHAEGGFEPEEAWGGVTGDGQGVVCEECGEEPDGHDHEHHGSTEGDIGAGPDLHLHPPGEQNHGTVWFFSQPWAVPYSWRPMLRDSFVLLAAALAVYAIPVGRSRR